MSCESINPEGQVCTIPGRHMVTHGRQDDAGSWSFWDDEVPQVSMRRIPTPVEMSATIADITQPVPSPFPSAVAQLAPEAPGDGIIPGTTVLDGSHCHACGRYSKVHRRSLASVTAKALIDMYRIRQGREYIDVSSVFPENRDVTKGKYWDLLEQMPGGGEDGFALGWWRLTDRGRSFVLAEVTVPQYAHTFNDRRLWYSGPSSWSIHDALGKSFDYGELMDSTLRPRLTTL